MERYVRVKKIGEGSFGKALLVKKKADGKQYVIKEIGISKMSPKERQESRREVKVLAQLKHPNIVSYQESFEENGNLYIVMDYCEAGDLYKRINGQRGIQMPEEEVLDYFVQICLGLKHVHDRKILHRDLKSQNIFLTKNGIVKLGDFGIARVLHSTVELARTAIGTPYYLSPEICENRPYNNKSDIWSLGCVLYELLTLKHAFEAGNMKNLVLKIIRGSYPPIPYKYSADIRGLVAQLLKRNAHDRPSINSILKKPFIQKRIEKFLSQEVMAEEFSHTVIHRKPLGVVGQPRMLPPKPVKPVPAPQKHSGPKAKYGVSVAKKKPFPAKKPSSADAAKKPPYRPNSAGQEKPAVDKNKEPDARERRRKEMMQNQEQMYQDYMKKVQQQRWERQQREQINRAREQAWKNTHSVGISPEKDKKPSDPLAGAKPNQKEIFKRDPQPMQKYQVKESKENKAARPVSADVRNRQPEVKVAGRPVSANDANRVPPAAQPANLARDAAKQGAVERAEAAGAAERARVLEEFWLRKKEAQRNKVRGQNVLPDHYPPANGPRQKDVPGKDAQEKDYLARLEAIRRQNFQERKELQRRMAGVRAPGAPVAQKENVLIPGDPRFDPEARKKKIAALKAQAEERAAMLRAQLAERKKAILQRINKEGKEKLEQENLRKDPDKRPLQALAKYERPAEPIEKPAVAPVGLETALKQVGATQLFRSNSEGDIRKMTEEDESESLAPPRKAWGNIPFQPRILPLEVTASAMEATSSEDAVLKPGFEAAAAARKQWGKPQVTQIISALGNAKLQTATTTMGPDEPDAGKKAQLPVVTQPSGKGDNSTMGATVTVQKPNTPPLLGVTVVKSPTSDSPKTVIVRRDKISEEKNEDDGAETQATITISGKNTDDTKKPVVMETILEGTKEGEKGDGTVKSDDSEDVSLEEVENITEGKEESAVEEKPAPRSPVKAWGEAKPSTPNGSAVSAEEKSPMVEPSLADNRAAYQEFLIASRNKQDEEDTKEALFERVEQKEDKEKRETENLEIQDISFDELSFHTADGSPNKSTRAAELQTGIYDTNSRRLRTCSLPDLRMLFEVAAATGYLESLGKQLANEENDELGDEEDGVEKEDVYDADDDDDDDVDDREEVDAEEIENDDEEEEEELNVESDEEEENEEFEDMLNSMRDVLVSTGRSPSPMKEMRDTSQSLDWDHCGDTKAPQDEDENDGAAFERSSSELSNLNEDWDSCDDEDEEDTAKKREREKKRQEEEESLFHRLEESRLMLEQELGFDKFLRVYRYLQAVQENEDDSAEIESTSEISELLGDKEHLYPKILYLVIADSAYSEDNQ